MRGIRRTVVAATGVAVFLTAVPGVVVAQSVTERLVAQLNSQLLYLAIPIAVLVESILAYTIWRFHDNDEPIPTRENRQLEITWTVATALVLLFVGTASFSVLASPMVAAVPNFADDGAGPGETLDEPGGAPEDAVEVSVTAEQWTFSFTYPDANVTTDEELVLPANRTVYLYVTAEDVVHSFHAPDLGLKQDAIPGQYNLIRTVPTERGAYRLYCAELCGRGHAEMRSTIRVVGGDEYDAWLDDRASADGDDRAAAGGASNESAVETELAS